MESRSQIPVGPPVRDPLPSYWHEPKSPLAKVVEAEVDNESHVYDHCIIGSGISGTMIAYNLLTQRPDSRIVMLEAREVCGGATGRNGGHTKAASYRTWLQHVDELGEEEAKRIMRFEHANILATHELAKELGIECESQLCNTVDLIYDKDTFVEGQKAIDSLRASATEEEKAEGAVAWYKIHSPEGATEKFWAAKKNGNPAVKEEEQLQGAVEYLAGRINAYKFSTAVLNLCTRKGLRLCTRTPVHAFRPARQSDDPNVKWEVFTQYSTIKTTSIIIATNGYTPYILPSLQGSIVPLRGQITAQKPGEATKLPSPLPYTYSIAYKSGFEYMIPRPLPDGGQHIVIGGGVGRLPDNGEREYGTVNDAILNPQISEYLRGSLVGYFGKANWGEKSEEEQDSRIVQEWTGIMGATTDGRPYVGKVPDMEGVWISAGFNGHGMVLCLKSAEALVQMVLDSSPEEISWFPQSFLPTTERMQIKFQGLTDIQVPETGAGTVETGSS
ncbi:FAD dependent oxidoreductase [Aaosphaeria arxii CBS 175.79]|uniref:FAD dependent oxidoreductase n=1 Tax=Aaosphaeria arxii CBS 175.79 TaxID=1450172 RepID=A0A6A5XBH3_9PLEO|nr:FAD dependent oxidoreductase [Aaosphaeria arxii CBS 175.79]KAF2010124.1 FAD dependent oxidoreductase [Aaosphaeria arxii CBS 175.79]